MRSQFLFTLFSTVILFSFSSFAEQGQYIYVNVGGATQSQAVAFMPNTKLTLNGMYMEQLDAGQPVAFESKRFDVLVSNKPIFSAGVSGKQGSNNGEAANIVWSPVDWAGHSFSFNTIRGNPQRIYIYALENATVKVFADDSEHKVIRVNKNRGTYVAVSDFGNFSIRSSGKVLAYHVASPHQDAKALLPESNDVIGFASMSARVTSSKDTVHYRVTQSDGRTVLDYLDGLLTLLTKGPRNEYKGPSLRIQSYSKLSAMSAADGNGNAAAPFMPVRLLKRNYIVNTKTAWVAFASMKPGSIRFKNAKGSIQKVELIRDAEVEGAPYYARIAGDIQAGTLFKASTRVGAWYQPAVKAKNAGSRDETVLVGY